VQEPYQIGDILAYHIGGRVKASHCGLYVGNGRGIHAAGRDRVRYEELAQPSVAQRFVAAFRVRALPQEHPVGRPRKEGKLPSLPPGQQVNDVLATLAGTKRKTLEKATASGRRWSRNIHMAGRQKVESYHLYGRRSATALVLSLV